MISETVHFSGTENVAKHIFVPNGGNSFCLHIFASLAVF